MIPFENIIDASGVTRFEKNDFSKDDEGNKYKIIPIMSYVQYFYLPIIPAKQQNTVPS
jgi:hypothetical protein